MRLRLAELREKSPYTQEDMAKIAGVSPKTEWNWEQGKTYPNASQLWDMAVALGCTPNDLLGWYETHPADIAPRLSQDEAVLLSDYRECTPARRSKAAEAVRDQRDLSKESAADSRSREEMTA